MKRVELFETMSDWSVACVQRSVSLTLFARRPCIGFSFEVDYEAGFDSRRDGIDCACGFYFQPVCFVPFVASNVRVVTGRLRDGREAGLGCIAGLRKREL